MCTASMNAVKRVKHEARKVGAIAVLAVVLAVMVGCGGAFNPPQTDGIDFTMTVTPGSQTAGNGNGARYTVTVAPPAMIGFVNLSVSGLPAGVNAAFSPGFNVNGSRDLNIFTTATTPQGNAQLTITASDPSGSRSATVNLTVTPGVDFGLSVTPNLQIVKPGASADYTVSATFIRNATGPVNLKVLGLPPGATAVFNPASIGPSQTSTLTLTAGPQFITEGFLLSLVGTDSSGTLSTFFTFDIFPADFRLTQSVGDVIVNAGGTVTGQIDAKQLFGSPGPISLSASNLPPATTAAFNPAAIATGSFSTMTISTGDGTPAGIYSVTINGVDASGANLVPALLEVAPGNPTAGFFLAARPTLVTLNGGEPATFFITVSNPNGGIPPLTFTASTNNNLVDASVFATNTPGVYELDVSTSASLSNAGVSVTVVATGPNGQQSISVNLIFN